MSYEAIGLAATTFVLHIYYLSKIKKSEETTNEKNQNQ